MRSAISQRGTRPVTCGLRPPIKDTRHTHQRDQRCNERCRKTSRLTVAIPFTAQGQVQTSPRAQRTQHHNWGCSATAHRPAHRDTPPLCQIIAPPTRTASAAPAASAASGISSSCIGIKIYDMQPCFCKAGSPYQWTAPAFSHARLVASRTCV